LGTDETKIPPELRSNAFVGSDYPTIFGADNKNFFVA
jgi:hypothetical protein